MQIPDETRIGGWVAQPLALHHIAPCEQCTPDFLTLPMACLFQWPAVNAVGGTCHPAFRGLLRNLIADLHAWTLRRSTGCATELYAEHPVAWQTHTNGLRHHCLTNSASAKGQGFQATLTGPAKEFLILLLHAKSFSPLALTSKSWPT